MAVFIGLNLRSLGQSSGVEIVLVWSKLVVLVGLAGFGAPASASAAIALILFGLLLLVAIFFRPWLLRHVRVQTSTDD